MSDIDVPEVVARAAHLTDAGRAWLATLPATVAGLAAQWRLTTGAALTGGTASYVVAATTAAGADVVLKVALPPAIEGHAAFDGELTTLRFGGSGYCRLLSYDVPRRALLLERLGASLHSHGLPVDERLAVIATTLRGAWVPAPHGLPLTDLRAKGEWLADFVARTWEATGRPCSRRTVDAAVRLAQLRARQHRPADAVVLHGDAHPHNLLASADGFRLVDPDGVVGEREYDLAIPLRELTPEELGTDPVATAQRWCRHMAEPVGGDPEAVWQWAFVERVSTGLLCARLGHEQWAGPLLAVADEWSRAPEWRASG
jgi:streptomycin 6-kinase